MIKVTVNLKNDYGSASEVVEITKEELRQFACNKAKGMYHEGAWATIHAEDEIEVKTTF